MRLLTAAVIAVTAAMLFIFCPRLSLTAHADSGPSDVYVFTADLDVSGVSPTNPTNSTWWVGGTSTAYTFSPTDCLVAYSDLDGVPAEMDGACRMSTSAFSIAPPLLCGSGVGFSTAALTITENGADPNSATVASYTVVLLAGLGLLEGGGMETSSGTANFVGVFVLIPGIPALPANGYGFGPCEAQFKAIGVIIALEVAASTW